MRTPLILALAIIISSTAAYAQETRGYIEGAAGVSAITGASAALALYWSYLPVVSVQIQRSAPDDARASAAGVLYSSMWLGAALGGLAAVAAPNWRYIVGGAALSWALAGVVAWRGFLPVPSSA